MRILTIMIIALLFQASAGFADDMPYWVQFGEVQRDLSAVDQLMKKIPDTLKGDLMVCSTSGKYALVHKSFGDYVKVDEEKAKLEKLLSAIPTKLVQYGNYQCFAAGSMLSLNNSQSGPPVNVKLPGEVMKNRAPLPEPEPGRFKSIEKGGAEVLPDTTTKVLPDVTTRVFLSNRDVNRITCMGGQVKDVVYSTEKGITTKIEGSDVFVKFKVIQTSETAKPELIEDPCELYVICGQGSIYTLIGTPKDIPAQTIQLAGQEDKLKKNISLFEGLALENKILSIMHQAYLGEYPESYTIKNFPASPNNTLEIRISRADYSVCLNVQMKRMIKIEGEGFKLKEYHVRFMDDIQKDVRINEKDFLLPDLTENPVGISLDSLSVKKGRVTRLFILEQEHAS